MSEETALMITSRKAAKMTVADVNKHTRNHWVIENKVRYVRGTRYREDYNGNGFEPATAPSRHA